MQHSEPPPLVLSTVFQSSCSIHQSTHSSLSPHIHTSPVCRLSTKKNLDIHYDIVSHSLNKENTLLMKNLTPVLVSPPSRGIHHYTLNYTASKKSRYCLIVGVVLSSKILYEYEILQLKSLLRYNSFHSHLIS